MTTLYTLAIKWGPAWSDQPVNDPDNYDHWSPAPPEDDGVTLERAVEIIRAFPRGRVLEITLEPVG